MATAVDPAVLATLPLFSGLGPEHLSAVAGKLRQRAVAGGVHLMTAEEPGEAAYLIISGTVRVYRDRADGTEVILAVRGPGEIVGEMSLLDESVRSASVVTAERCTVLWVERATFRTWLLSMPALSFNLACVLSRRLRVASAQIEALAGLDIHGRVARQLLVLADEYGQPVADSAGERIPFQVTQTTLASMVGASRPRVNGVISLYRRLGYLTVDATARITILNRAALAERCQ